MTAISVFSLVLLSKCVPQLFQPLVGTPIDIIKELTIEAGLTGVSGDFSN